MPQGWRIAAISGLIAIASLTGCEHSHSFVTPALPPERLGPFNAGSDGTLTFNVDQDYWPEWTDDGRGILYAFVTLDATLAHRCMGILPAAGGTRLWQLCDNRTTQGDSMSSFSGYALDRHGRLLYAQAVSPSDEGLIALPHSTLWLADTTAPFVRQSLLVLPVTVGPVAVTWLTDITWIDSTRFLALGQQLNTTHLCPPPPGTEPCPGRWLDLRDSIFDAHGIVTIGTIVGSSATLAPVEGTDSATSYSLADNGATLVFTRRDDPRLLSVPSAGGIARMIGTVLADNGELLGVACRATACVVATAPIATTYGGDSDPLGRPQSWAHVLGQDFLDTSTRSDLRVVSLIDGSVRIIRTAPTIMATPHFSPDGNALVVQFGCIWG
ncbi:MAG: hypothetical protein ACREL5_13185, partial [Gemmatimonadales bacterium]